MKNDTRLSSALNPENGQANIRTTGNGISIKGIAGPYVVEASNFAPGTTAADIESAMLGAGLEMTNCRIMINKPTVIAEMVFAEKIGAENVIARFNGQRVRTHRISPHTANR